MKKILLTVTFMDFISRGKIIYFFFSSAPQLMLEKKRDFLEKTNYEANCFLTRHKKDTWQTTTLPHDKIFYHVNATCVIEFH